MTNNTYAWTAFYMELADKLLPYREHRDELISKIHQLYENTGLKMPKLESDGKLEDIDPFTVIGLFNKGILDDSRRKIAAELKRLFEIDAPAPISFAGIPILNNMKAAFYRFKPYREEDQIENLWALFAAALSFADDPNAENQRAFCQAFDVARDQKGVQWNLSMGLYWIRPYQFINLDSRNRWFISETGNMPENCASIVKAAKQLPNGEGYLEIGETIKDALDKGYCSFKSFPALSERAWHVSKQMEIIGKGITADQKPENALGDSTAVEGTRYWIYAAGQGSVLWEDYYQKGIMAIGWGEIGDLAQYADKAEIKQKMKETYGGSTSFANAALATWQFANELKAGDIVFVKKGVHEILGRGVVTSEYRFDPDTGDTLGNIRDVEWTHKGNWAIDDQMAQKTLTDITQYTDFVEKLEALFEGEEEAPERVEVESDFYGEEDFLEDVYMDADRYHKLVGLLKRKKNIILQGAPGVGKTFVAKRLAYSIIGKKDKSRVQMVQFHQSYSYEDFIMGFRPTETGFRLHTGAFYDFCKKAQDDKDNAYFFIIDEINRGNISRIFGELFMLIEADKRGISLGLLYKNEQFSVPENLYIIGMMNTADRSLAMLDYALRRRFAFFSFAPAFGTDGFEAYRASKSNPKLDKLIQTVVQLNEEIAADDSLGEGFRIGHSYFITDKEITDEFLEGVVDYELIPLLNEYWYDEPTKVRTWSDNLRRAIK